VLGGFANLRPAVAYPALADNSPLRPEVTKGCDILFVRELLGGLYFGQPRSWNKTTGEAINTMRYTRDEVVRVARVAFELAGKRRKKLTSVDKANVLECSQLWRATVDSLKPEYPDITVEHQLVDSMAMHLMNVPRNFDVVLTENLFGDILSDESGIITGSLGMLPSATIGGKVNLYTPHPLRKSLAAARRRRTRRRAHDPLHRPPAGPRGHLAAGLRRPAPRQPQAPPSRPPHRHGRPQRAHHQRARPPRHHRPDRERADQGAAQKLRRLRHRVLRRAGRLAGHRPHDRPRAGRSPSPA
jgi:hypothetical protein